jgi:hypothetical protein
MRLSPLFATGLLIASGLAAAPFARAAEAPYEVVIWADAKYDAAGALTALEFPQAKDYSEALLGNLRNRIAARPAAPKLDGDVPATYETGVRVTLTITPETGTVAVDDITDMPLVLRMTQASVTEDMAAGATDWDGRVMASCTVSVKGRCGPVEILTESGDAPEEARRIAKKALAGWRFQPQKVGGKPVEGKVVVPFVIERTGVSRPTLRNREA